MKTRWMIAWRNLMRNGRRTFLNFTMIVSGFCAIVVFEGFGANILRGLERAFIEVQYGNLQVGTDLSWDMAPVDRVEERLIPEPLDLIERTRSFAPLRYVSGRLSFYGMLSTSDNSVSARAVGFDPHVEAGVRDGMVIEQGRTLSGPDAAEVMVGEGILKALQARPGDNVTVLAQTVDGSINAMDLEMVGVASTGVAEIDNVTFYLPLQTAQKLLDTDRVERLVYLLEKESEFAREEAKALDAILPEGLSVRTWFQLGTLYQQSDHFFATQNLFISLIILVLVLLSISNTVSNSVTERIGEIGTVRAMGDRRSDVTVQFVMEAVILSTLSGVVAIGLGVVISEAITAMKIGVPIPGTSKPIPLGIDVLPWVYLRALFLTAFTTVAATLWPVWKASKLPIVEALKRNV